MGDDPPDFAVKFRTREPTTPPNRRVDVYQDALDFAARVFTVIELAEVERFYLRDTLDRRSTAIAQLIAQALATSDMASRRLLYQQARCATTDCAAVLDILSQRGTVEPEALTPARDLACTLVGKLVMLAIPPPMVR